AEGVPPSAFGQLWVDVEHELARTGELARRAVPAVLGLLRQAIEAPQERAAAAVGMVRSLTRLAVPTTSPLSPVMTGRSLGTSLAALRVPLAETRERARSAGGTINDAFVATVLDGLRRYHTKHGATPPALRVGVPISTRSADRADDLANQVAPARIVAPLQLAEFGPRLAAVHDLVAAERAEPALAAMDALAAVANRLPVAAPAIGAVMRSMDVMASNVPGSPAPLFLGPAKLLALVPFGPRAGAALNVTVISYDGALHIGVNMDPAATPDTGVLADCLRDAFDQLVLGCPPLR
ncbi:MAG: WS/DGAT domain-containing protein, partial [Actinomycetes bacterium]